jgi:hypothetical protein
MPQIHLSGEFRYNSAGHFDRIDRAYCALNHYRNGYLAFVNRLPLIQ